MFFYVKTQFSSASKKISNKYFFNVKYSPSVFLIFLFRRFHKPAGSKCDHQHLSRRRGYVIWGVRERICESTSMQRSAPMILRQRSIEIMCMWNKRLINDVINRGPGIPRPLKYFPMTLKACWNNFNSKFERKEMSKNVKQLSNKCRKNVRLKKNVKKMSNKCPRERFCAVCVAKKSRGRSILPARLGGKKGRRGKVCNTGR